jgi:predicted anti-sigma-YlaC factor YlaD
MACLSDEKILAYGEGDLKTIAAALVRDHLRVCPACRQTADRYRDLNQALSRPRLSEPPARMLQQVLQRLYPVIPRYTSIAAMIAASFVFLITWIYVYFDFSGNSLIQALQLTADHTSGWLVNIIKAISAVYHETQAAYKASSALLKIILSTHLGSAVLAGTLLAFSGALVFLLLNSWLKKARERKS